MVGAIADTTSTSAEASISYNLGAEITAEINSAERIAREINAAERAVKFTARSAALIELT